MSGQNEGITILKYGNTNTYFIPRNPGGLLIDTDLAGTLPAFYKAIKANRIRMTDITRILATHYHPDHIGLVSELMKQGIHLLLIDSQIHSVHDSDAVFAKDRRIRYTPIDETAAAVISCEKSREFLSQMGIGGEIISTPSHSPDSISLILDSGDCIVGDLEPFSYLDAYDNNPALENDWNRILAHDPKRVFSGHANVQTGPFRRTR